MPDQWGRTNFQDGLGLAQAFQGMQTAQKQQTLLDTQIAGMQATQEATAQERERKNRIQAAEQNYYKQYTTNGGDFSSFSEPQTREEHIAMANVHKRFSATREAKQKEEQYLDAVALKQVQDATPFLFQAENFARAGKLSEARPYIAEASKILGSGAYAYEDDGSGYLVKRFRSDKRGDYEDIAHVTEEEALAEIKGMLKGEIIAQDGHVNPEVGRIVKAMIRATGQGNTVNATDPTRDMIFKDKDGNEYRGVVQNSPFSVGPSKLFVYGPDGKRIYNKGSDYVTKDPHSAMKEIKGDGNFTRAELIKYGLQPEDLERDKTLLAMDKTRQDIQTSKAHQGLYGAQAAGVKADNARKAGPQPVSVETGGAISFGLQDPNTGEFIQANSVQKTMTPTQRVKHNAGNAEEVRKQITSIEASMKNIGAQLAATGSKSSDIVALAAAMQGKFDAMPEQDQRSIVQQVLQLSQNGTAFEKQLAADYLRIFKQWQAIRFPQQQPQGQGLPGAMTTSGGQPQLAGGAGHGLPPAQGGVSMGGGNAGVPFWKQYVKQYVKQHVK